MRYRPLGRSALVVSAVGLGCNNFGSRLDADATASVVGAAIDTGVTFFDTADIYGNQGDSERFLGAALASRRDDVLIATKFGMDMRGKGPSALLPRGSRAYAHQAVRDSLTRLNTDYVDLLQFHEPDPSTPISETLSAMAELVEDGLVRFIGCSNFTSTQLTEAQRTTRALGLPPLISTQERYHLLDRTVESSVLPTCLDEGIGLLPYYPLANGLLTGKYISADNPPASGRLAWRHGWVTEESLSRVEQLRIFGAERGLSVLDVAIGGLAAMPAVGSVIAGATTPEQVVANARAANWAIGDDDVNQLDAIVAPGERVVG